MAFSEKKEKKKHTLFWDQNSYKTIREYPTGTGESGAAQLGTIIDPRFNVNSQG